MNSNKQINIHINSGIAKTRKFSSVGRIPPARNFNFALNWLERNPVIWVTEIRNWKHCFSGKIILQIERNTEETLQTV